MVVVFRAGLRDTALLGFARPHDADLGHGRRPVPAVRISDRAAHSPQSRHRPGPDRDRDRATLFHRHPDPDLRLDGPARPQRAGEQAAGFGRHIERARAASVQSRHGASRHDRGASAVDGADDLFQRGAPRPKPDPRGARERRRAHCGFLARAAAADLARHGRRLPAGLRRRDRLLHYADPARGPR